MWGHWPVRRWFRILWCISAVGCLAALPFLVIEFKKTGFALHDEAWFISAIFVLLAIPVTIYEVAMHLEYFSRPALQIHVIRILWMVPIYAVDSWLALRFKSTRIYCNTIREFYEAFVIYSFFMYLLRYLHDEYGDVHTYFSTKEDVPHMWGVQWVLKPWAMGETFFWECKKGILNYVILRPLMTAVSVVATLCHVYGDGELRFDRAYLYVVAVNNFSQGWALYCLVLMYTATHSELAPIRPLSKFLVVKSVIFFSFWQSVAIALMVQFHIIRPTDFSYDVDDVAAGLQNFLICIEMFPAALVHAYAFPPRDYLDPSIQPRQGLRHSLKVMFDVRDVVDDMQIVVDDTVQRTTDNIAEAGRTAWSTARTTTNKALATPRSLMNAFGGRKAPYRLHSKPGDDDWLDEREEAADSEGLQQALLRGNQQERESKQ
ncbi:hypothetical protein WJX73_006148 [Symbiochloris irregularis]|uniref:Transmembrane protein 184C n=1 Tax=Symbiochloris irregularis TaxID=706552 RepID=A0AAW1NR49_9CHLO